MSNLLFKRWNDFGGWLVFLIAAFVYGMTIEPTASFWDCPEFISCAEKLQVGIRREHLSICLSATCLPSLLPMLRKCREWSTFKCTIECRLYLCFFSGVLPD